MTRPQGDPTCYLPVWLMPDGDYTDADDGVWNPDVIARLEPIPAERVTVAPEPYTPKVGDRVTTTLGYEGTLLATEPDSFGRIPILFHIDDGDRYSTIDPGSIDRSVQ